MKTRSYLIVFACLLAYLSGCQNNTKTSNSEEDFVWTDSCTLEPAALKRFPLDSTAGGHIYVSYFNHQNRQYLNLFNIGNRTLYIYNWTTGDLKTKLVFQREGPNGVGDVYGAYMASEDSIFLLAPDQFLVSLVNGKGDLVRQYYLYPKGVEASGKGMPMSTKEIYVGRPIVDNYNPISKHGDYLYMGADPRMLSTDPDLFVRSRVLARLNLADGTLDYSMPYPELYRLPNKHYPLGGFSEPSFVISSKGIVFNFSADFHLYCQPWGKGDEAIKKYYAPSTHFTSIPSSPKPFEDMSEKALEFQANTARFERLLYNPWQNLYYRMAWLPDKKEPFSAANPKAKFMIDLSLIILDQDFRKIGEHMLPRNVNSTHFIQTPEGLYGVDGNNKDEDWLVLQQFKLKSK